MPKVFFLTPYPLHESPSQRFRFEQYFNLLEEKGIAIRSQSFLTSSNWRLFSKDGNWLSKINALLGGFMSRIRVLFSMRGFDFVFIHREATPLGPPVFEWIIARVLRKKIIYDFDDAIWFTDRPNESPLLKTLKWRSKVAKICRWSHKVSCGNDYLATFARNFNSRVVVNPTTIDAARHHNKNLFQPKKGINIVIGWTGSYSTLKYLKELEGVLVKILADYPSVRLRVIADQQPALAPAASIDFIPWNEGSEVKDLLPIDIGIMPMPDDEWTKGKCGFKALQYMSLEIPTIASPVGMNTQLIQNGVNGFLASGDTQWYELLKQLIGNAALRESIGKKGRETVVANYSVDSNSSTFLALFE